MRLLPAVALIGGLALPSLAQDGKTPQPTIGTPVSLAPGDPASKLGPRYSPPGRQLKLEPKTQPGLLGFDHLEGRIALGPNAKSDEGQRLVLARSEKGKPYDLLFVHDESTGQLGETPIQITPKLTRGKTWSSFEATMKVKHGDPSALEDFPVAFWTVVEKETDTPDVIRVSRRGFLAGSAQLGETPCEVILSDSGTDGVFTSGDWWELRSKDAKGDGMRSVGDYAWSGGKAYMLLLEGTNGRKTRLIPFDPGITHEQDLAKRDLFREDRLAEKAAKPVSFRKDVDAALKDATANKGMTFLKFETDWCGPCHQMTQFVFTSRDVAEAAKDLTCIVVDGDARKDLTEKYTVKAYPTGILFDAEGKEVARYLGYQSVKETTAFLKQRSK